MTKKSNLGTCSTLFTSWKPLSIVNDEFAFRTLFSFDSGRHCSLADWRVSQQKIIDSTCFQNLNNLEGG